MMPDRLTPRSVTDYGAFRELRPAWSALQETFRPDALPLSWEWFDAWWRAFGEGRRWRLAIQVLESGGRVAGVLPLMRARQSRYGLPLRTLHSLANGHSPYWDVLLDPAVPSSAMEGALQQTLATEPADVLQLRRIADDSPLRPAVNAMAAGGFRVGDRDSYRVPLVQCASTLEAHLMQRAAKYRKNLRKKLRDFADAGASVECVRLESSADPRLRDVIAVSSRSWKAQVDNDLAGNAASRAFLEHLIDHLGPRGAAQVWIARLGAEPIAYELHLRSGRVTFPVRADYDERFASLSPGSVVEFQALEAAFHAPGIGIYDTCADDYWYLRNLTHDFRVIHDMQAFAPRALPALVYWVDYRLKPWMRRLRGGRETGT